LYALKYANILTKALNLITIKNHFLLHVFITRYLLHSLKFCKNLHLLTFRKNFDKKNGKSRLEQHSAEFHSDSLCYACYVPIE